MADVLPFCRLSSQEFLSLYKYAERNRPADCKPGMTTLMLFMNPGRLYDQLVDLAVHYDSRLSNDDLLRDCHDQARSFLYGEK
jgi:hypothetical protein